MVADNTFQYSMAPPLCRFHLIDASMEFQFGDKPAGHFASPEF